MIWPSGNFIQEARANSLSALIVGTKASPKHFVSLTDWRKFSSVSLISSSPKELLIHCNKSELSSSLVGEIEIWADREIEMRAQILRTIQAGAGFQDSWFVVSCYYWATFSSCMLLRLLGTPVFRMNTQELSAFDSPGSSSRVLPKEGTFRLMQHGSVSVTTGAVSLRRLKGNYHQSLWIALNDALNYIHKATMNGNSNETERLLISAVLDGLKNRPALLSDVRNIVNYQTGVGFPAASKGLGFSIFPDARSVSNIDSGQLLSMMSNASSSVAKLQQVSFRKEYVDFLYWSAVTLSILGQTLYSEVSSVIKFDRSWGQKRIKFAGSTDIGVPVNARTWVPFVP